MADRRPHVRFLGDEVLAKEFLRYGKSELYRTKSLASLMGVPTYARRSPILSNRVNQDESYVLTTVAGGIEYIDIFAVTAGVTFEAVPEEDEAERRFVLYSGFAYKNWMPFSDTESSERDLQYPAIQDFQPTIDTYRRIVGDFPFGNVYQANERLNIEPAYSASSADSGAWGPPALEDAPAGAIAAQTQIIRPCMFSGLLQQAAAISLGIGDLRLARSGELKTLLKEYSQHSSNEYIERCGTYGVRCEYKQTHTVTHGIVQAAPGVCWLVECSQQHGMLARRLPVLRKELFVLNSEEAAIVDQLGGVPTGEAFDIDIADGIDKGRIFRVNDNPGLFSEYYDTLSYAASGYSWCFNPTGSEARTTTFDTDDDDLLISIYWKLQITVSGNTLFADLSRIREDICVAGRAKNLHDPNITFDQGRPEYGGGSTKAGDIDPDTSVAVLNVGFARTSSTQKFQFTSNMAVDSIYEDHWDIIPDEMEAVIWVGWIDGRWSEIYYRSPKITENYLRLAPDYIRGIGDFLGRWSQPGALLPFIAAIATDYDRTAIPGFPLPVPEGLEDNWIAIPKGYSTDLLDFETFWQGWDAWKILVHEASLWHTNMIAYVGGSYRYVYVAGAYMWRQLPRTPRGRHYFLTVPFNRNAYFCVDRSDMAEFSQTVSFLDSIHIGSHRTINLGGTGGGAPSTTTLADSPESIEWGVGTSFPPGEGRKGDPSRPVTDFLGRTDIEFTEEETFTPIGDGDFYYHQYVDRTPTPFIDVDPPFTNPTTIHQDNWYNIVDLGVWFPYSFGQAFDIPPDGAPTLYKAVSQVSTEQYPATEYPKAYTARIWLVADRFPGETVQELITLTDDDVEAMENWEMEWWCQVAVLGTEAAIYTDFSAVPAPDPALKMQDFAYTSSGVHPPLPDTGDTYQYTRLTFVGVNGP